MQLPQSPESFGEAAQERWRVQGGKGESRREREAAQPWERGTGAAALAPQEHPPFPAVRGLGQTQGSEEVEGQGKLLRRQGPAEPGQPGASELRMPNGGLWLHVRLLEGRLWGWAGREASSPVVRSHVSCPQWKSGQLVQLGWTASEDLLCIQEDGTVLIYNLFCEFKRHFSMGNVSGAGRGAQEVPRVGFVQRRSETL